MNEKTRGKGKGKGHTSLDVIRTRLFGNEQPHKSFAGRQVQLLVPLPDAEPDEDGEHKYQLATYHVYPSDLQVADAFLQLRRTGRHNWKRMEVARLVAILRKHMKVKINVGVLKIKEDWEADTLSRAVEVGLACMFLDKPACKAKYAMGAILVDGKP